MLDVGWTELVVIAIVLIIVVGPKDLPPMLRTFGRMMSKMRGMAADFRHQFDEALREADLDDVRKTLTDAQKLNPANSLREAMNPLRQMGNDIKADLQKATRPDEKPAASSPDLPPAPDIAASAVLPAQPVVTPPVPVEPQPMEAQPAPALAPEPVTPVLAVPVAGVVPIAADGPSVPSPRKRQPKVKPADDSDTPRTAPRKRAGNTTADTSSPVPRTRKPAALADEAAVADIGAKITTRKPRRPAADATKTPDTPKSGDDA